MLFMDPNTLVKLHGLTTSVADDLAVIRDEMMGRGISPVRAPIIQARLQELENTLRKIGADPDNPVPFTVVGRDGIQG